MKYFLVLVFTFSCGLTSASESIKYFKTTEYSNLIMFNGEITRKLKLPTTLDLTKKTYILFQSGGGSTDVAIEIINSIRDMAIKNKRLSGEKLEIYFGNECASSCTDIIAAMNYFYKQDVLKVFAYKNTKLGFHGVTLRRGSESRYSASATAENIQYLIANFDLSSEWHELHMGLFAVNIDDPSKIEMISISDPILQGSGYIEPENILPGNSSTFELYIQDVMGEPYYIGMKPY